MQSLAAYVASLNQDVPRPTLPGVVHCFTGSQAFAEQVLGLGFYLLYRADRLPQQRRAARSGQSTYRWTG
ncbi:MAG: hypothetical protein WKG07_13315 [Hymenobacter sp.]